MGLSGRLNAGAADRYDAAEQEADMKRATILAIVFATGACTTASAQQPTPAQQWKASRSNPYSRLFPTTRPNLPVAAAPSGAANKARPQIKCGMTIIQGDASIDPGIQAQMPAHSTRHTIRVVEPTICR